MEVGLTELAAARQRLQQLAAAETKSIEHFHEAGKLWYRVNDQQRTDPSKSDTARHLTTTVTCLEALIESQDRDVARDAQRRLAEFIEEAFSKDEWASDDAAWVYCRVRTLKVLATSNEISTGLFTGALMRLEQAWQAAAGKTDGGLRESTAALVDKPSSPPRHESYPPNAFLTYHGVLTLHHLQQQPHWQSNLNDTWMPRKNAAISWLRQALAEQIAFHYSRSSHCDPQQLAWALCALVRFTDPDELAHVTSEAHDLLSAGLRAFFAQQQEGHDWPIGRPLFHYPSAGNAYCYPYETLAELLTLATLNDVKAAPSLKLLLRGYASELLGAVERADLTKQPLGDGATFGWSSGHHLHRLAPESWATASAYRFIQALRRLVGAWSCEEAARALGARTLGPSGETLAARGDTWDLGRGSAGAQLAVTFVNPVLAKAAARKDDRFLPDPDEQIFDDDQARSAMLFGPPGTGKTTLVAAVALALGWSFVEVTPAQFLGRGVDFVSAQADELFRQIMELDRCVVLLDELDELIQFRDDRAEPLERFFTTTMLPRLAKLWKSGRVLFFANTNGITQVDPAVRRSQRFDAAMFVLTPGFDTKSKALADRGVKLAVEESVITSAVTGSDPRPSEVNLGWFALARYDQLSSIAGALSGLVGDEGREVDADMLSQVMQPVGEALRQLDWPNVEDDGSGDATVKVPVADVIAQKKSERRDQKIRRLARWDEGDLTGSAALSTLVEIDPDKTGFVDIPRDKDDLRQWAKTLGCVLTPDGRLEPTS